MYMESKENFRNYDPADFETNIKIKKFSTVWEIVAFTKITSF